MRDRMLAGDLYIADDPALTEENQRAMALIEEFNRSPASKPAERRRLLTDLLGPTGRARRSARRSTVTTVIRRASGRGRSRTSV